MTMHTGEDCAGGKGGPAEQEHRQERKVPGRDLVAAVAAAIHLGPADDEQAVRQTSPKHSRWAAPQAAHLRHMPVPCQLAHLQRTAT